MVATLAVIAVASYETLAFSLLVNLVGISIYSCKLLSMSSLFQSCCPSYYSELDLIEEDERDNTEEEPIIIS
jgi:hypothetical protein